MKKEFVILMILLASASFADTYNGILTDNDYKQLMTAVSLDEFNSAIIKNPAIAYNDRHEPVIFTPSNPASPNTEFRYSDGYTLYNLSVISNNPFVQLTAVIDSDDDKGSWVGINELSNPYNTQPGAINVTQNMATQEHTVSYSQTASTATTNGWFLSAGVSYEYKQLLGVSTQGITISVEGGVNGSTTDTKTTTTSYTDIAKSFTVPVPAGCKAVVTQSLGSTTFHGDYAFSTVLDKAQLKFNVVTGSVTSYYTNSGYVDIIDLVKNGSIPQDALTVDSSNNLLINGKGKYTATGASNYTVNVAYEEATPGTTYCMPPSEQTFNDALAQTDAGISADRVTKPITATPTATGFSYKVAYNPEHRKAVYSK